MKPTAIVYTSNTGHTRQYALVEADRLFDRFYTVENAKGSTGLGLSIAKQLTEKMGGSIQAEWQNGHLSILLHWGE